MDMRTRLQFERTKFIYYSRFKKVIKGGGAHPQRAIKTIKNKTMTIQEIKFKIQNGTQHYFHRDQVIELLEKLESKQPKKSSIPMAVQHSLFDENF